MKKKLGLWRKTLLGFAFLVLILLAIGFKIYFVAPIKVEKVSYIDDYKTISLEFDTDIILDSKTKEGIYITDSKGVHIPLSFHLNENSRTLIIKPFDKPYSLGQNYILMVNEVQGRWFGNIKEPMLQSFNISKLPVDESYGLGKFITEKVDNDKDYYWYVDQATTGEYAGTNCGPASAEMIGKWVDENFKGTAKEARELDYGDDGGWYTENIKNYLDKFNIKSKIISNVTKSSMISYLKNGNILLLGIKAGEISFNDPSNKQHKDRFYWVSAGHFIIVKGYIVVDKVIYFEVYDPNSWYETYDDGSLMGINRYYKADEVVKASKVWYDKLLLVEPN
ncbi:C39 family peptidase [Clostridium grantii]|uniref:Peptidase_C39 like family protein n=1 Tax=Clostridium grantii DSM 8605 TaxID=1121316 RepID=A0A1M5V4L3_9CLOT|nr:C39 family peptidase [Clostridium grantii]SHH70165.1 Peptidase_C39 like family protein [Clostridium grantii DSM 8605]